MSARERGTSGVHDVFKSARGVVSMRHAMFAAVFLCLGSLPLLNAHPVHEAPLHAYEEVDPKPPSDPSLWAYLGTAVALVLLGGAFAGLTIALMGQDEIYLQVIATSGEGAERRHAKSVLKLLKKGKHWVLVTLLLSNVITNETLPIVLDRSLGGGWPAVLSSTVLIVIFGEIAPQSVCVRYGLPIGAWMSPFVLALMWILAPVAWPTAKLLDYLLGEDHGTTYKKAGLKTLVTLHKTLGTSPDERLNQDEVTIIGSVLDLKDKPVGSIMTPMNDVFTLSADAVLDEKMMDNILSAGYSRIPIYAPDNQRNFIGMLLVKMLITYDPEDALRVRDFALATLPETRPETSCLDILNFFQEGKSHMILVSDFPGEPYGALGVVTLEDVIEELIGEEIIDESDVFVDVHKAIRRMAPAPRTRVPKGEVVTDPEPGTDTVEEGEMDHPSHRDKKGDQQFKADGDPSNSKRPSMSESTRATTFLMRRRSSGTNSPKPIRSNTPEMRQHLKHLGPSNAASRPKSTRINTVKIKPGVHTIPEAVAASDSTKANSSSSTAPQSGIGEGLLAPNFQASDGVQAVHQGYGTMSRRNTAPDNDGVWKKPQDADVDGGEAEVNTQVPRKDNQEDPENPDDPPESPRARLDKIVIDNRPSSRRSEGSHSTVESLPGDRGREGTNRRRKTTARSGSITEQTIDVNGVKKLVLDISSSSDGSDEALLEGEGGQRDGQENGEERNGGANDGEAGSGGSGGKKKRKKRAGKKKRGGEETRPLLGDR